MGNKEKGIRMRKEKGGRKNEGGKKGTKEEK